MSVSELMYAEEGSASLRLCYAMTQQFKKIWKLASYVSLLCDRGHHIFSNMLSKDLWINLQMNCHDNAKMVKLITRVA